MEAEIEDFIEGFNQPYRGMRIQGQRCAFRSNVITDSGGR